MGYRSSKNKTDYILKKINKNYITESRTIRNLIRNMQNDITSISYDVKAIKDKEQKHYDETIKRFEKIKLITAEKADDANNIIKSLSKVVVILLIVITVLTICVNFGI